MCFMVDKDNSLLLMNFNHEDHEVKEQNFFWPSFSLLLAEKNM